MNNTFNLKRFGLLLKKTLLERPVQMFGFTGLLLGVVLIMYVIIKSLAGFNAAQNISFIWGLPGGGFFLASFAFNYFSSNANGASYLTLPASHFEKWLCGVLITGVFYVIVFLLFFRIMDYTFVSLYHSGLDKADPFYKIKYDSVYLFSFNGFITARVYKLFIFLVGAMLVGSLYFNKVSFIKVAIILCVLCIGGFALNWLFAKMFFNHVSDAGPFNHVSLLVGSEEGSIELPDAAATIFNAAVAIIIPVLLWTLAFLRLKEKEF